VPIDPRSIGTAEAVSLICSAEDFPGLRHLINLSYVNIGMKRFMFLLLLAGMVFAETAEIGIYVINAGKFDPQTGGYTIDFYLSYICQTNCTPDFEFSNGRATSIDKIIDEPSEKFYRIQALLQDSVDLKKFPFDSHQLTIEIEDKLDTTDRLVYIADKEKSGLEESIQFVGWKLNGWDANVDDHYYPVYDETYSRYIFSIDLEREALSSLLKIFAPVFFIMMLNFATHFLDPPIITNRITLHSSFLVATVMFHVAVGNQLPPLGYLTVADKFMFAAYIPLTFSIMSAIAIMELNEDKKEKTAMRIHKLSKPLSVIIWLTGLALVLLTM